MVFNLKRTVSKKALLAVSLAVLIPLISYLIVKRASDGAIAMPHRLYYDSVMVKMKDGKKMDDTIWHKVSNISLTNQLGQTVSLAVSVSSCPPTAYQWYFDQTNALAQASMKLGEAMYKQSQEAAGGAAPGGDGGAKKEDVVDAEFTEVDDDKKNKKSA